MAELAPPLDVATEDVVDTLDDRVTLVAALDFTLTEAVVVVFALAELAPLLVTAPLLSPTPPPLLVFTPPAPAALLVTVLFPDTPVLLALARLPVLTPEEEVRCVLCVPVLDVLAAERTVLGEVVLLVLIGLPEVCTVPL